MQPRRQNIPWKTRLARWRRKYGVFTEKKHRLITQGLEISPGETKKIEVSCTPQRNYTATVRFEVAMKCRLQIEETNSVVDNDLSMRTHHCLFQSQKSKFITLKITNKEATSLTLDSLTIKMGGGTGCDHSTLHVLFRDGHLNKVIDTYTEKKGKKAPNIVKRAKGFLDLLENGIESQSISSSNSSGNDQYLYLVYSALSFNTSGYTMRSQHLLQHLNATAYSRLGYPRIIERHINSNQQLLKKLPTHVEVDGINYHIVDDPTLDYPSMPIRNYIQTNAEILYQKHKANPPKAVIAASNYVNGYIGYLTSRILNVPFAYEMRGLWHITGVAKNQKTLNSDQYKLAEQSEIDLATKAEQVFVLSPAMKDWLIERGIEPQKIKITPNGVDIENFVPKSKPELLLKKLKLENRHVFGFIGSLTEYEGVDLLIRAFKKLSKEHDNLGLVIVGDGQQKQLLEDQAQKEKFIHFIGQIPHTEIQDYYHLCDTMVYARTNHEVCRLVPPLKPVEALATGKLVICSDVPPMLDYLNKGMNGLSFKAESLENLIHSMKRAIEGGDKIEDMKRNGPTFIKKHHQWKDIANTIDFLSVSS